MNRVLPVPLLLLAACTAPTETPAPAAAPTPAQAQTQAPTAAPVHAHAQRPHSHAGTGSSSACAEGRYNGPIQLYPPAQVGDLDHKVSTANADAQRYFNQGLTFFYGFDAESAMRSFHQASVLDPKLAMAHWGIALAAGGDLNIPIDDPCMVLAGKEIQEAENLGATDEAEKAYIKALAARYPGSKLNQGSGLDVAQLGVKYALQMETLQKRYATTDPDVSALYAYSLMNLRPWHWWQPTGQPTREVSTAIGVLDAALARFQNHIGLNHIKIHAVEEAPIEKAASLARPSAEYLFQHAPAITPHLNHMPAHIFLLLGDWQRVVEANERAVAADQPWAARCADINDAGCNQLLVGHYYSHDMLFLDVGYDNQGLWEKVKPLSAQLEENVSKFVGTQPGLEHYLTTNVMMMVHFARWRDLDALPPPDGVSELKDSKDCARLKTKLASAIWFFGRAMAHAHLQIPTEDDVRSFLVVKSCAKEEGLEWGHNSADNILKVVQWRMFERIARKSKEPRYPEAVMFASLAVEAEDILDYDEPPAWYLSSRETFGAALYLDGRYDTAAEVFKEDQRRRPNNSRSLFGLWKALEAQGSSEAGKAKESFNKQWKADKLPSMDDL